MTLRDHPQDITHWVSSPDGFGGYGFAAPVLIKGRWEDKVELIRSVNGDDLFSSAIVYLSSDVASGDYMAEGDQTLTPDPSTLSGAHEVKQFDKIPSLRNLDFNRKAMV